MRDSTSAEIAACIKSAPGGDCTTDEVKAWLFTSRNCVAVRLCRILDDKAAGKRLTEAAARTWQSVTNPDGKAQLLWARLNSELLPVVKSKAKDLQGKVGDAPKAMLAGLFAAKHSPHEVALVLWDWTRKPLAIKADLIFPYHGAWGLLPGDKVVWNWVKLPHSGNSAVRFPPTGNAAQALPVPPIGDFVAAMVMNRLGMMVSLTKCLAFMADNWKLTAARARWTRVLDEELLAVRGEIWDTPDAQDRAGAVALLLTYLALEGHQSGFEADWSVIPWPAKPENMSLFVLDRLEDMALFPTPEDSLWIGRNHALSYTFMEALCKHPGETANIVKAGLEWLASRGLPPLEDVKADLAMEQAEQAGGSGSLPAQARKVAQAAPPTIGEQIESPKRLAASKRRSGVDAINTDQGQKPRREKLGRRQRRSMSPEDEAKVFEKCRRRCCVCFVLDGDASEKKGQLAHLDQNRSNNTMDNFVYLCFHHHDTYDSKTSQSKNLTEHEVRSYQAKLHQAVEQGKVPRRR